MGRKPTNTTPRHIDSTAKKDDQEKLAKIQNELFTQPEWEDYPCRNCTFSENPRECRLTCGAWKTWWKLHWQQMCAEGKRIIQERENYKRIHRHEIHCETLDSLYADLAGVKMYKHEKPAEEPIEEPIEEGSEEIDNN